ncbi:helix-turn-helix domain-containing protein [Nocardia sp. NPDC024068]|uniref:TetR/AcrR family transcriptional regulator n=1 Tax=Nocardia sp. NPDC024068 TaxID=3157197 RepID=UPI0033D06510
MAAIAEFKRGGIAAAEVGAIVSAAGVAHGTFFFHFPTKEHVLLELERREEARMAADLSRALRKPHGLDMVLEETVRVVRGLERRLGVQLFKDFLALHFSTTKPPDEEWTEHPFVVAVVEKIEEVRTQGETNDRNPSFDNAMFFLLGLYALLITTPRTKAIREPMLARYVSTMLHGMTAP